MNITLTEDDLILFIYGEADEALEAKIKAQLITDKTLQAKHRSLLATIGELKTAKSQPHDTSIKIIMEESAMLQREKIS